MDPHRQADGKLLGASVHDVGDKPYAGGVGKLNEGDIEGDIGD